MTEVRKPIPRRIFRATFTRAEGSRRRPPRSILPTRLP